MKHLLYSLFALTALLSPQLAWAHNFTDVVWRIKNGEVNATEEFWHNKWIRVTDYHDANITLSLPVYDDGNGPDTCIMVHNILDGLTDMIFGNPDMTKAPSQRTNLNNILRGVASYSFHLTADDGTTSTVARNAQKIERDGYDCYTVPFYNVSGVSDGSNSSSRNTTAISVEKYTAVSQVNRSRIFSETTGFTFYVCEKGTTNVMQTIKQHGFAIRGISFNADVTSYSLNYRARAGVNEPQYQEYRERVGFGFTQHASESADYRYPEYDGKFGFNNFDNIGRSYTPTVRSDGVGGITSGKRWWTTENTVTASWLLTERKITFAPQITRGFIMKEPYSHSSSTAIYGDEVAPIGSTHELYGKLAFSDLGHPQAVADEDGILKRDNRYANIWANTNHNYWGHEIGYWGQITTASAVVKIPRIEVVIRKGDTFSNQEWHMAADTSDYTLYALITDTEIRTPHRLNVTPYVPLVIDSYGRHECTDGNDASLGTYIYVNGRFDMDQAFNADILDHCDLYILPGRYTETAAKTDDFANTENGHTYGKHINIAQYRTDYRGTYDPADQNNRVTPLNDATHFNLAFPEADLPQVSPTGEYSFYIKAYFKHGNAYPVVDDNPEIHPVYMALTPKGDSDITTGIDDIYNELGADDDAQAPVEYYNLQGQRVANPSHGQMLIRHQGRTNTKVLY